MHKQLKTGKCGNFSKVCVWGGGGGNNEQESISKSGQNIPSHKHLFASWTLKGSASGGVWGVSPIKSFNETRLQINDGNFYVKFFRPHSLLSGSGRGRGN